MLEKTTILQLLGGMALALAAVAWDADERTRELFLTTVMLGTTVAALALPAGTAIAWFTTRTDVWGGRIATLWFTALLFLPLFLQAAAWDAGFGRQGWFSLTNESAAQPLLSGFRAAVWIHALAAIPWVILIIAAALRQIDPELEEAARLELSPASAFRQVTLPQLRPALLAAGLWVFVVIAGEMTVTDLYQVRTFAEEFYVIVQLAGAEASLSDSEIRLPRGTGVLVALIVLALLAVSWVAWAPLHTVVRTPRSVELGRWRGAAAGVLWLLLGMVVGVPFASLVYNAGVVVEPAGESLSRHWSVVKFLTMVAETPFRFSSELLWSAVIGGTTAAISLLIAIPLAWLGRGRTVWRSVGLLVSALGIAIPGPMIGFAVVRLFHLGDRDWLFWLYDHSIAAPVLALTIRALPAAWLLCWFSFQSLPPDLLELAAIDGWGTWRQLWGVAMPLRWRSLLAAGLVAFIVSSGDVATTILVIPPGLFTIPIRVFGLLHAGVDDQVAGLCLTILLIVVTLQACLRRLWMRSPQST